MSEQPAALHRKAHPAIATSAVVDDAIRSGATIYYNLSGGKDSGAATAAVHRYLEQRGHPPERRHAIHADLGDIEWRETRATVEHVASRFASSLAIVGRPAGGLIDRWTQRFDAALERYINLETYFLVGPFSSARLRFCTSEMKAAPIERYQRTHHRGETVISVIGLRREESRNRANTPVSRELPTRGLRILHWNPLVDWTTSDVFAEHAASDLILHPGYTRWGATRIGCSACILASVGNLIAGARNPLNAPAFGRIVALELSSTFSFQPNRWLAETAADFLEDRQQLRLAEAQRHGTQRRLLEQSLPADLRFARGWPPRIPTLSECGSILEARTCILAHHDRSSPYATPSLVRDRFAELHAAKAAT